MKDTRCTRCGTELGPGAVSLEAELERLRVELAKANARLFAAGLNDCPDCIERKAQRNAERLRNQVKPTT